VLRNAELAPYVTGGLLGLLFAISLVALGHPVGVSGAIRNLVDLRVTWQVWVLVGVACGAAAVARRNLSVVPAAWAARYGRSIALRWGVAFLAGVVLQLGASIAGGCTSGLALSGGIVLSPGAFVFMAAMFATGIPAAQVMSQLERRRS
jgi:hypothetical protein